MSFEAPVLSAFEGIESLEAVASQIRLVVSRGYGQAERLEDGETLRLPSAEIRQVGLKLDFSDLAETLVQATKKTHMSPEDLEVVVIGEGRFLKDRHILGQMPISSVEKDWTLLEYGKIRHDALRDKRHGFAIHCFVVLAHKLAPEPRRPRRLGTIVGQSTYRVFVSPLGSGLRPKPLSSQILKDNRLPKGTLMFVSQDSELLSAESLDEALSIYIDEKLFSDLGAIKSKESRLVQTNLAVHAIGQVVYMTAAELHNMSAMSEDVTESVVFDFLFRSYKTVSADKGLAKEEFFDRLRRSPANVAAALTASKSVAESLRKLVSPEED